jgi:hypothetical protein
VAWNYTLSGFDSQPLFAVKLVMVKVIPTDNPECSWQGKSPVTTCANLKALLAQLTSKNYLLGIFSTARIWEELFQGVACQDLGADASLSLLYANYGSDGKIVPNSQFDDFTPFGGFTAPVGKQSQGNLTIPLNCGATPWHAFVDLYTAKQ